MRDYLRNLLYIIGPARRRLPFVLTLFLVAAALDVLGVGIVPAAITIVLNRFSGNVPSFAQLSGQTSIWQIVGFGLALVTVFVVKNLAAFLIREYVTRFSEETRRDIISRLMRSYLSAPYEFHLARNTAVLVNVVTGVTELASGAMSSLLRLVGDLIMFSAVFAFLLWLDPAPVLCFAGAAIVAAWIYQLLIKKPLIEKGQRKHQATAGLIRATQNGIHAYKEVKILGVEQTFIREAESHADLLVDANSYSAAVQLIPRLALECLLVFFAVSVVAWNYLLSKDITSSFALLGAFAAAGMRMFPAVTESLITLNIVRFSSFAVKQLAADLRASQNTENGDESSKPADKDSLIAPAQAGIQSIRDIQFSSLANSTRDREPDEQSKPFAGFKEIVLSNITYRYPGNSTPAIQGISLRIQRGQAVGLMGRSGAGKSTLVDIMMGLLEPERGAVLVDGTDIKTDLRGWMQNIAYVPQMVNITDDTLLRNVAFGVPDSQIDPKQVWAALEKAQLATFARQLPRNLGTVLGERGIRLSGGQRQRVALARALYHRRNIIVMDEATSALDDETEKSVVDSISQLHGHVTLIIIAHRRSTLQNCDEILEINDGVLSHH